MGFVFAGQGSQRAGMGAGLHAASPVFAAVFDRACALLESELGVPVADVVLGRADAGRADETVFAQAGLFAVQAGLVALLAACGVRPDAVAGHSVGEVAAAHAAGVLSLEDACRLVAARARLMQALPAGGAMAMIAAAEDEVAAALAEGVSVAAVNGPASVVISGDAGAVGRVAGSFAGRGVRVRPLRVSRAFHSAHMDPVLAGLGAVAGGLEFRAPRIAWAGALTGELVTDPEPGYWVRQAREPVRYADAVATLAAQGVTVFLEIGPDGTLSALGAGVSDDAAFIAVQRPDAAGSDALVGALARAYVHGVPVDWTAVLPAGQRTDLPTYAFQRQRYWPRPAVAAGRDGTETAAEARFWAAVEDGDFQALAQTLAIDSAQPLDEALPALAAWRRREQDRSVAAAWRYTAGWTPVPDPDPAALGGTWLLITAPDPTTNLVAWAVQAMTARGARLVTLQAGEPDRAVLAARIAGALDGAEDVRGVVSLLAVVGGLVETLALVQALGDASVAAPVWVLTRGAVCTGPGDELVSPVQGQVWGLGRVAALEHPDRWGGLIDLPGVAG